MKIDTKPLIEHIEKLSQNSPQFQSLKDDLVFWIDAQATLAAQDFTSACENLARRTEDFRRGGCEIVGEPTIPGEEEVQVFFYKKIHSIIGRFAKALTKAQSVTDGVEYLGQFILAKPRPQKSKIPHYCKVVGIQGADTEYYSKIDEGFAFLKQKMNGGTGRTSLWNGKQVLCFWTRFDREYLNGRERIKNVRLLLDTWDIQVPNMIPKVVLVPVMAQDGGSSYLPRGEYEMSIKAIKTVPVDEMIGKFVEHITTI
jgi:hypothetical protein